MSAFDVCVIGTGAGGGVIIDALTAGGLRVVALQKGDFLQTADFTEDALHHVVRARSFAPDRIETYRSDESAPAVVGTFNTIADCVGGSTVISSGLCFRQRPDAFKVRSVEGPIAGTSVVDWPLDAVELEPWYRRAEVDFGVAGDPALDPGAPPDASLPNPPLPPRAVALALAAGARTLGLRPFPAPVSINSRPYGGRPPCLLAGNCRGFGCPVHAKGSTLSVSILRALASGRLDLRTNAVATELVAGDDGRVRSVRYLDWQGRPQQVSARAYVLAAGAIGSPHLLLMSRSTRFPDGLSNSSGLVGRNLMLHLRPTVAFVRDEPSLGIAGAASHLAIDDFQGSDSERGFVRGGVIVETNALTAEPLAWALAAASGRGGEARPWGRALRDHVASFARGGAITAILEDLPMAANRVDLDPDVRDRFGLPAPRITHTQHPNDVAMARWFGTRMLEIAKASGATDAWPVEIPGATAVGDAVAMAGSPFPLGTCRMGSTPAVSVVDRWCRSHDVENLWIVDGSVFPTAGGHPPMLTIHALAYRAAEGLLRAARS